LVRKPGRVYEPDDAMNERYRECFAVFEELYPSLKNVSSKLHEAT